VETRNLSAIYIDLLDIESHGDGTIGDRHLARDGCRVPLMDRRGLAMSDQIELAEKVREACLHAALDAYEGAGISGLCGEGRWEIAVQAIRTLDLQRIVDEAQRTTR
jgi:hypothetical protein